MWEWIPTGWLNGIGIVAGGILAILFAYNIALWIGRGWFRAKREHNHEVYKWRETEFNEHDEDTHEH